MYKIPELDKLPEFFHAFSSREDGNMANSINGKVVNFQEVIKNRKKFLEKNDIDINKCICMWVTHSDKVIVADDKFAGLSMRNYNYARRVDGLVTNKKGLYLFLLVADCLPIILYDPVKEVIGLVHAGWKGVDKEIVKKAIVKMSKYFESEPQNIVVGIGPFAHKESFFKESPSQINDARWKPFLKRRNSGENQYKVDLVGFMRKQLSDSGILEKNLFISEVDTVTDKGFFSHVREGKLSLAKQGRFVCIVGLKTTS